MSVPSDTLELIYEATLNPGLWQNVVQDIVEKTGGDQGALILQNQFTGQGDAVLANIDPAAIEEYFGYFAMRNPMQQHNVRMLGSEKEISLSVMTDLDIIERDDLFRTEYYNDFMRRFGMHSTLMMGLAFNDTDGTSIAITRPEGREDFGESEIRFARALQHHLIRALKIGRQLDTAQLMGGALADVLEKSGRGVFLVDEMGRIRHANQAGREIVAKNDGLTDKNSLLAATGRIQKRKFETILRMAASPDRENRASGSLLLPRLSRRHPLSAIAMPLNAETGAPFHSKPLALVCVSDPEQGAQISQARICDLFDFTPAEAKVAMELLAAEEPKSIAEHLGISVNTVRVHMASIFRKTHTNRQAELVRLLMQMTAEDLG
ncbi:MAG TPA: helix-turn-helix transcriptional regulator [Rhizomicrobium sp.]